MMFIILRVKKLILRHFVELSWQGVLMALASYLVASYGMLWLAGEAELTGTRDFIYWIVVTASTVGYGDLSPSTTAGKYITSFFVIPIGLGMFALIIGHIAAFTAAQWKMGIRGLRTMNIDNHILVIGWNGNRTHQLLKLLIEESRYNQQRPIVLCTTEEMENPLPEDIGFVRVTSFTDDEEMKRAAVERASGIIINTQSDDMTMTTALYCSSVNQTAHTIVYFSDDTLSGLLRQHCPAIECMPSVAIEMQVKAVMDPGSSALHQELLNAAHGMTQYSVVYPDGQESISIRELFYGLKSQYDATLIGVTDSVRNPIKVNPALEKKVIPGNTLFYIADDRIKDFDWESMRA
jgi:voltage-gated potassium channel